MGLYFKQNNLSIYNGDCLDVLNSIKLPDKVLLFTDPPYGIGEADGKNKTRGKQTKATDYGSKNWDNKIPPKEYFDWIFANTKDQIIFGGNYFIDYLHNASCFIVWNKEITGDFADCELAWTSFKSATRMFTWTWNGMIQQNMSKKEKRFHPTQKPVGLAKWILKKYWDSDKYDVVLDTHMGSGSFGVACRELNIPYIGIDKDIEYCEIAKLRLGSLKHLSETATSKKGLLI